MATFSKSTMETCSDSIIDFCCSPCLEHKIDQWAELYCDTCQKFYCAECATLHGQLFGKHVTYGRGDTSKWPASKEVQDFLLKCDLHEDKHLEMYCNDHSQLCCTNCAFLNHRLCTKVTLISESARGPLPDLQQLSRKIQTILEEVKKLENHCNTNMLTLQASYNKLLDEIRDTRQTINIILDKIEKNTIQELDDKMTSLKASIKTDLDNCIKLKNELKQLSGAINDIIDKGKAELTFIASKKCLEQVKQSETYLKENSVQVESSLTFQADSDVQQYLSKLSGLGKTVLSTKEILELGDPDQVFTIQGKSEYDVSIPGDSDRIRDIIAICVLSDDEILVADCANKRVKLLNHQYQVVGHCDLTGWPWGMCKITPSEVAVTVDSKETHGVQFVSVNGRQLVKGRKLQFQHDCLGIAHDLQDLYLTSGTALYKYSMKGALLNKVYEDTSDDHTVWKCAVSPSGDKIFVTNQSHHKVLTLATDGTVLHTFTNPDLQGPNGIHVTDLGQVLVCGWLSKTIIQLDGEGKKKLATLASERDGLAQPWSVYFNRSTASIIVAQSDRKKILVFKVK
ncbi:transcription intermediary factor 1-alpha-like [Dreissena polymorpha]|uniref:transcription intermediary factor 1-alpha-like n=1 Tax=Dreissena polymorpha TaxID=45954 RepID=UPI00226441F0|nr:transcription intermediary factor 1-alpha-like [Dreissena polymorpha]